MLEKIFNSDKLIKVIIIHFFIIASIFCFFNIVKDQQFSFLSQSFLQGKLYFLEVPGNIVDTVNHGGYLYWPLGPFPAVVLMPFTFVSNYFENFFHQGYLQFFLTLITFYFCYYFSSKKGYSKTDSLYLALAFCFASVQQMVSIFPSSWFFAQSVTTVLLFWCFYEYFNLKRYLLIGIVLGLVFMTRFTAGLALIFFILEILVAQNNTKEKLRNLFKLIIPIIVVGVLLLTYNQLRFGNLFDNGYEKSTHILVNGLVVSEREPGLFMLRNIPTNFYYYFLKSLDPIYLEKTSGSEQGRLFDSYLLKYPYFKVGFPGVSFFVVSPVFLYLFRNKLKKTINKNLIITILIILLVLLTYYWPGWKQVGPRYLCDLLPLLFLVLIDSFKNNKINYGGKILIILSSYFDLYLLLNLLSSK